MIRIHDRHPLHRMESMGIRLQLGHASGVQCINPLPAHNNDFVIIDYNGIYEVGLDFCGCAHAELHIIQLLRVRLFPATTVDPKTAATFQALEYFQMLSFESKVSTFEFYKTAARLTDNTGIHIPKDCYEALLRMMREWRFIKQMKCASQSHHPDGIGATKPGACAIFPRFLYALFLAIDTNFRLARHNVSSDIVDPGLNRGYVFFVEEHAYKDFIGSCERVVQELSSCSSHNAVNLADSRVSRGLAATGASTIDCARHNFKRPCSVGDLQKGERYLNMDYLFFSSMQSSSEISTLNISYDIACQWSKHLWTRMSAFPHQYHIKHDQKSITFLIPKFHLPAHVAKCQSNFSFNFIKGVGRTDGEAPERGWADINPIATSTHKMGPGSRRDTLDDHFNDWNWKKICAMAADELVEWRRDIEAWEADPMTQAAVRLALSMAEAAEIERGNNMSLHDDISPSVLISSGLELEDQQLSAIGHHTTDVQKGKILQRMNALRQCIDTWARVQVLYMPSVSRLQSPDDIATETKAHNISLFLPSSLPQRYKDTFIRGQRANTRANGIINNAEHRIDTLSLKYSTTRDALRSLKPLDKQRDAVPLKHDNGRTVGQQSISWIWRTSGFNSNELGLQDSQAHRWEEEVQLLREEMCHIIAFLDWQAGWWDMQGPRCAFNSLQAGEGALAYAQRQANLRQQMVIHIKSVWAANPSWQEAPLLAVHLRSELPMPNSHSPVR
ncbi:uncharacterized protein F5891DRAFT_1132270 [Suillus fuscotomentosus]|uniref:CxC2-like cysteine cluster KDZ transposase-associated domain-containing protein n=1 Tax=Suillus fuscotomentosus TaxID=1912939 RepID=A0AAD4HB84_9AGAM|nr:uncharacterized protein F5891DRAFT_1132270 [Suillus fuscotomentosus]KAG1887397.1 hypothetical protein F5891DRAFT_1132270 [Suillus fuscotomentosus]